MPVGELLARTSSAELVEWLAYEQMAGPLGGARADIHAGIVASTIANVNTGKRGKKYKPADFIPKWSRVKISDPAAMRNMLIGITKALGGKVRRRGEQ